MTSCQTFLTVHSSNTWHVLLTLPVDCQIITAHMWQNQSLYNYFFLSKLMVAVKLPYSFNVKTTFQSIVSIFIIQINILTCYNILEVCEYYKYSWRVSELLLTAVKQKKNKIVCCFYQCNWQTISDRSKITKLGSIKVSFKCWLVRVLQG